MTVLNTIELTKTAPVVDTIMIVSIILTVLSFIGTLVIIEKHEKCGIACFAIMILSVIGIIACGAISDTCVVPTGEYHYEIMIDDNTPFAEVIEKYDIIEQRGEIFVVEEKE